MNQLVQIVRVTQEVDAYQRIPEEYRDKYSFYSLNDWWQYFRSYHPNMCEQCDFYGSIQFFNGPDIRLTFPYREIISEDLIYVHVHPNCICELQRVLGSVK